MGDHTVPDSRILGRESLESFPPGGSLGMIQPTIGSPRFLQLSLHLIF
jgi:hypothetical protein